MYSIFIQKMTFYESTRARPTNVARIRIPEVIPFMGRVCCWFSPLCPCVFSANNLVFPFPQKGALAIPNSKCYWEMVDEELLCEYSTIIQSHLFIIFYCKTKCGYYDLRYNDILGVMEIEIYEKNSTEVKNILSRVAR